MVGWSVKYLCRYIILSMLLAGILLCGGCAGTFLSQAGYGKLRLNDDVRAAFKAYYVNPRYNYYISGNDIYPNAIMGLDEAYTLKSTLWKKRHLTPESLETFVRDMTSKAWGTGLVVNGYDILDDAGRDIGDWFSVPDVHPAIRTVGEREVSISTPPLDLYERFPQWKKFSR